MAPRGERPSARGVGEVPDDELGMSATEIDVISVDTDAIGVADDSLDGRSDPPSEGRPPPLGGVRPLTPATYNIPLSSKRSARISWNGESSSTNAFPEGSTRRTRPGDSVPTSRFPARSNASDVACVALA